MAMSDCPICYDTPCTCKDAKGYRHLSIQELEDIKGGIEKLIEAKKRDGHNPEIRTGVWP